jgi:hypothetical protein
MKTPPTEMTAKRILTDAQKTQRAEHIAGFQRVRDSFFEAGMHLMILRDEGLYLDEYETFGEFCEKELDFGRQYAYRLISSAEVVKEVSEAVSPIGDKPAIPNEAVARELAKAPKGARAKALKDATDTAKGEGKSAPTAKDVKAAVEKVTPPAKSTPPPEPDVDLKKNPKPWLGVNERIDRITGLYSQLKSEIVELASLNGSEGIYVGWMDLKGWRKAIDADVKTFDDHKVHGFGTSKLAKNDNRPFIYQFEAKSK